MKKLTQVLFGTPDKPLIVNGIDIICYVLADEKRVISQSSLYRILGIAKGSESGSYKGLGGGARLMRFLDTEGVKPLITKDVRAVLESPILFEYNKTKIYGYEATTLQKVVKAIAKAYLKNELNPKYSHIGARADILNDVFSETGIVALIDEFTGYKYVQDKKAIQTYLEKAIRREYAAWVQRFPIKFFEAICRLKGWQYEKNKTHYPPAMGHVINDVVYKRLAPGILDELKVVNPVKEETGRRKVKHHSWLTDEVGIPSLAEHLIGVQALIEANTSWRKFSEQLERVYPVFDSPQLRLDFPDTDNEE